MFAGIVTLLNQSQVSKGAQSQAGLGNINPDLYRLASAGSKAFHDITTGNNIVPCSIGTPDCSSGSYGYSASPGYDMATGLGSVDVANLVNSWTNAGTQTTINVMADHSSFARNGSVQLSIAVSSGAASAVPTGILYATLNNPSTALSPLPGGLPLGTATLAEGSATIQIYGGQLNAGANTIMVTYSGDARFNGSSSTIAVNVNDPATNSAVVLSAFPYYYYSAYQNPPIPQIPPVQGTQWDFHLQLKEVDGVGTTVTGLSINGVDQSSTIPSHFGAIYLDPFGTLNGTWGVNVPSVPVTIPVVFSGKDGDGTPWTTALQVPLTSGPEQFVVISNGGLVNAASFRSTFAPGMILSVFGGSLTNSTQGSGQAQSLPLPLTLAGSSATINGVPAPYYYASYGQVNVQVPYETAPGDAILTITGFAGQTFNYAFKVQPSAPGIFVDPNNDAPVPSESGSPGQEMVLYITGEGLVTPALATGATPAPGTLLDQLPKPRLPVTVMVGHLPAQIAFIGITPGIAGATQINYFIPPGIPSGFQPVIVTVGGVASQPAFLTVQ